VFKERSKIEFGFAGASKEGLTPDESFSQRDSGGAFALLRAVC
jgi:hypothetical protein